MAVVCACLFMQAVFPFWLGMIVAPQWGVTKKVRRPSLELTLLSVIGVHVQNALDCALLRPTRLRV